MHPATMQAVAAQRGCDLRADAAAARRARKTRRSPFAQQARPVLRTRADWGGSQRAAAITPFRGPQEAA